MARRVPVELTLQASQYLAQARAVRAETASVDRQMDQLGRSVDAVDRDMAQLSASAAVAARQVDNLGDQARGAITPLTALDARIKATRLSVRELAQEFARTGDKADAQALAREERALARMERLRKQIAGVALPGARSVVSDDGSGEGIRGRWWSNPYVIAGITTAVVGTAPALGAMIGGLLAGAIGTVGVAGGLAAASKSPQVQAEAKRVGDVIVKEFFDAGDAFVGPAIRGLGIVEKAVMKLNLTGTLGKSAPQVEIITQGFADLVTNTMPGLNMALDRMTPFAHEAAEGLSDMGYALSRFLDDVTSSEGAVMGLKFAFNLINTTIIWTGRLINILSDTFDVFINVVRNTAHLGAQIPGPLQGFFKRIEADAAKLQETNRGVRDSSLDAAAGFGVFGEAADQATIAVKALDNATNTLYNRWLDSESAEVAAEAALDDLADALQRNGLNFDKTTKAGQGNVTALIAVAQTAEESVRKMLIQGRSVEDVEAAYEHYRQELYDAAIQAGATAEQAQTLVDKWLALSGLQDIEKNFIIHQTTYKVTYGQSNSTFGGGFQEFAAGGSTPADEPFWAGEKGRELIFPNGRSQFVATQQQAQQWGGSTTWGGSDRTITVIVKDTSGRTLKQELINEALSRNVSQSTVRAAYP